MCDLTSLKLGMDGFQPTNDMLLNEIKNSTNGVRYEYVHKNEQLLSAFFSEVSELLSNENWIVLQIDLKYIDKNLKDESFYRYLSKSFLNKMDQNGYLSSSERELDFDNIMDVIEYIAEVSNKYQAKPLLIFEHFQLIHEIITSESQLIILRDLPCIICYIANITVYDIEMQLYPEVYDGNSNLHGTITKSYIAWNYEDYFEDIDLAISNT